MSKFEAWAITAALAVTLILIPTRVFRWVVAAALMVGLATFVFAAEQHPRPLRALVFVDRGQGNPPIAGTRVPMSHVVETLWLDLPCPLPLVDTRGMHPYKSPWRQGCWYRTLSGGFVVIDENGSTSYQQATMGTWQLALYVADVNAFDIMDKPLGFVGCPPCRLDWPW